MSPLMKFLFHRQWQGLFLAVLLVTDPARSEEAEWRVWTSTLGTSTKAVLIGAAADFVMLRLEDGREVRVELLQLSEPDRSYVEAKRVLLSRSPIPAPASLSSPLNPWPEQVGASRPILLAGAGRGYETPHFMFRTDEAVDGTFVRRAAAIFEDTLGLVDAVPLDLRPSPPEGIDRFVIDFTNRRQFDAVVSKDYRLIPGQKVFGVYLTSQRRVLVPYDAIWDEVKRSGGGSGALVHEVAHQAMHEWLPFLPVWLTEGLAECFAVVPLNPDGFDLSRSEEGLKFALSERYRTQAPVMQAPGVTLAPENFSAWKDEADRYLSALLTTYFFMHLDGVERGRPLADFLSTIRKSKDDTRQFIADYNQAVVEFEKKRLAHNAAVEQYNREVDAYNAKALAASPGGAVTIRKAGSAGKMMVGGGTLPPTPVPVLEVPEIIRRNQGRNTKLDIVALANDAARPSLIRGRSFAQLESEMKAAYARIGITVTFAPQGSP